MEKVFLVLVFLFLSGLFLWMGSHTARSEDPAHFFVGISVKPEHIRDVPAYNRACGRMWRQYGLLWLICGCAAVSTGPSLVLLFLTMGAAIPGSIWLVLKWSRIREFYKC